MKRFFIMAFCIFTMFIHLNSVSAHTEIDGFAELYEKIWIDYYDQGVRETMEKTYTEYIQKRWEVFSQAPDYMKRKVGYEGTLEEQKELFWYNNKLDFDEGFAIWFFNSDEYLLYYANQDISEYLVYIDNYWAFPFENSDIYCKILRKEGGVAKDFDDETSKQFPSSYVATEEELTYLKNLDSISAALKEYGISSVDDMKVVVIDWGCTALYVKSDSKEYMIRMHDYGLIPEFEKYKVYTASEAIKMVSESTGRYNKTKPTFEEEALSLQSEGLLNGTDKGLDLLKPLTRIETATMLLRAMGEETLQEETVQTFADVSNAHWGHGAAEKAYSLGLIRGVGDNLFAPDGRVTKEQFATMVLRAGNYGEFNWEEAFDILVAEGIISAEEAKTMDFFTRGDMAKIIYEAKNKGLIE